MVPNSSDPKMYVYEQMGICCWLFEELLSFICVMHMFVCEKIASKSVKPMYQKSEDEETPDVGRYHKCGTYVRRIL